MMRRTVPRPVRGLVGSLAFCAALGTLTGCYYTVTTEPLPASERSAAAPATPPPYAINVGDHLGVKFYQNPDLNEEVIVRPDGKISLQLIGEIQAAGIEPGTLQAHIEDAYRGELAAPRVVVMVRELGARVYVGGEVGKPGVVPLTANLTLVQAIQEAGGLLSSAHLSQVVLIRRDANGNPVGHAIDVRPVIGGTQPAEDVPLQPFDIAYVPPSKIADVGLWVKQYIRDVLPITPGLGIPLF
ncbi:MAG TPA: polysaccharide biosynthesis/export family protein [Candidatus Dormibacteraeota bacterium]|nr:polysaccharide biosynthesis/export family protein [Candidatus Dormibacteraeota bacterium]